MKTTLLGFLGCILIFFVIVFDGISSSRASTAPLPRQSRYIYCNVYLDYACFGIAGGDVLNMEIPGDFTLYSISIGKVVKAQIYYGNNPQRDGLNSPNAKSCSANEAVPKCTYAQSPGVLDLLYQANANAQFIHIHMTGIAAINTDDIRDFLANFRSCKPIDQSVQCSNERIFRNVAL